VTTALGGPCRRRVLVAAREPSCVLELYVQPLCPYCRKVERALADLGLDYETHRVSFFKFRRSEVRAVSGQSQVPVLVDPEHGVEGMCESDDIVEYLYETYGQRDEASTAAA
jgi:glutaredoxin 3